MSANGLADGEHRLELRASADSWVEIVGRDGRQLERDLVRGGETREYQGAGPFDISIGRSSSIQMFLDGEPVDLVSHTREDVARLRLDPEALPEEPVEESIEATLEDAPATPVQES